MFTLFCQLLQIGSLPVKAHYFYKRDAYDSSVRVATVSYTPYQHVHASVASSLLLLQYHEISKESIFPRDLPIEVSMIPNTLLT